MTFSFDSIPTAFLNSDKITNLSKLEGSKFFAFKALFEKKGFLVTEGKTKGARFLLLTDGKINRFIGVKVTTYKIGFKVDFFNASSFPVLEPLAKTPLSTQLKKLTGDNYSDINFYNTGDIVIHRKTGQSFVFASQQEEDTYKVAKQKEEEEQKELLKVKHINRKEPFIYLHNTNQFMTGLEALQAPNTVIEMCEDSFYHFLECVPPKRMTKNAFVCGEPYTHLITGEGVYLCGFEKESKFYAQYGTIKQFESNELFKNL